MLRRVIWIALLVAACEPTEDTVCQTDADCGSDEICDCGVACDATDPAVEGVCEAAPATGCSADSDCPSGQICDPQSTTDRQCIAGCRSTAECGGGETCNAMGQCETQVAACGGDHECNYDEVCEAQTCVAAGAGAERTFGQASIEVTSSDDVFLLGLYNLPTSEASPDESITVSLTLGGGGVGGGLSVARSVSGHDFDRDRWRARLRLEGIRHRQIDRLVSDLQAGRRSLHRSVGRHACPCDNTQMCWKGECVDTAIPVVFADGSTVTCDLTVVTVGDITVNMLLDQTDADSQAEAESAVTAFAETLAREQALLGLTGHDTDLDRDADGRLTVVFTNKTGGAVTSDIVGFFWLPDFLPASDSEANGNEADLLWSRVPSDDNPEAATVGTLAHEYLHLASYAKRVHARNTSALREVLWLDEGMAHLMEDLSGWGASNLDAVAEALSNWPDTPLAGGTDSVEARGMAYLYLRHLIDSDAKGRGATSATDAATTAAATAVLSGLVTEESLGFEHSLFQQAGAEGMWKWLLGVYATGREDLLPAANTYDYLALGDHPDTDNVVGINTHESYVNALDLDVDLEGPEGIESVDGELDAEEYDVVLSGSLLLEVTGLEPGTYAISGIGEAGFDTHLAVEQVQ